MNRFRRLFQSSIGAKGVMAVTGLLIFLWVVAHMVGNLLIFAGRDALNAYSETLRMESSIPLWVARVGLFVVFVVHILSAVHVWRKNRAARPEDYAAYDLVSATFAGRTMMVSGVLVLLYVVYHLLHLTLGVTNPEYLKMFDPQGRRDVYSMVILGFSNVTVSAVYIGAMVVLGFHLRHGVTSMFQTLGLNHPAYNSFFTRLGPVAAVVIVIGFVSVPLAVLAGFLRLP